MAALDLAAPLSAGARLRWDVVSRLLPAEAGTVLEIGCGQGGYGARLANRYPSYLGLEPDAASCNVAARRLARLGRGEVRCATDADLPAGAAFDLVGAFEVLEHLDDDRAALARWVKRLRPGGTLMLSVPAHPHRFGPSDRVAGHYRRYSPAQLARLLTDAGLVDVDLRLWGFPLGYALEQARHTLARRRLGCDATVPGDGAGPRDPDELAVLTAGSGRWLQPASALQGVALQAITVPFLPLQRRFPSHGIGLVARARKPRRPAGDPADG